MGQRMRNPAIAVLAGLVLLSCHRAASPTPESQRYATREGQEIILHPSGITLRMPRQWLEWDEEFHNNLHLTRKQLESVRDGGGEWDTEYGEVVNATLPFADCVAHIGGEGWGREGASFGDVQLRVYMTTLSNQEIFARIHGEGLGTARRVARQPPQTLSGLAPDADVTDAAEDHWRNSVIRYRLWYGDYGGTARVRFYVTSVGGENLVLVFMGGDDEEVRGILQSVSFRRR